MLSLILSVFVMIGSIPGSLAWLIDEADPLTNTFVYGDINIELIETDTGLDQDNNPNTNTYKMIPGEEIIKDPTVTVLQGSEDCWLFIKLEKLNDFDEYMDYTILIDENSWKELDRINNPDVYYRKVSADEVKDQSKSFAIIQDNKVTVKAEVTKEMLNALDDTTYPRLKVSAYAVQRSDEIEAINTAIEAWKLIPQDTQ